MPGPIICMPGVWTAITLVEAVIQRLGRTVPLAVVIASEAPGAAEDAAPAGVNALILGDDHPAISTAGLMRAGETVWGRPLGDDPVALIVAEAA